MIYIVTYILSSFSSMPCQKVGCCVFHGYYEQRETKEYFENKEQMVDFCYGKKIIRIDSAKVLK